MFCSGCARTAARGAMTRVRFRPRADTSRCCSGRTRTAARGTKTQSDTRRETGTSRWYLWLAQTAHPNTCQYTSQDNVSHNSEKKTLLNIPGERKVLLIIVFHFLCRRAATSYPRLSRIMHSLLTPPYPYQLYLASMSFSSYLSAASSQLRSCAIPRH